MAQTGVDLGNSFENSAVLTLRPGYRRPPPAIQRVVHLRCGSRLRRYLRRRPRTRAQCLRLPGRPVSAGPVPGTVQFRADDEQLLLQFSRAVAAGLDLHPRQQYRLHGLRHRQEQEVDVGGGFLLLGQEQRGERVQLRPVCHDSGHMVAGLPRRWQEAVSHRWVVQYSRSQRRHAIPVAAGGAVCRFSRRHRKFPGLEDPALRSRVRRGSRSVVNPNRVHSVQRQRHRLRKCEVLGELCPGELVPHR